MRMIMIMNQVQNIEPEAGLRFWPTIIVLVVIAFFFWGVRRILTTLNR